MDIITIGSAVQDTFLQTKEFLILKSKRFRTGLGECFSYGSKIDVERMFSEIGGGATNTAVTFANLGFSTGLFSYVGDDLAGKSIREAMEGYGVDTTHLQVNAKQTTGQSVILMTLSGDRTVLSFRGASAAFAARDLSPAVFKTRWMYVSAVAGNLAFVRALFAKATKRGVHLAWNPGQAELRAGLKALAPLIQKVDVLLLNREEAAMLSGKRAEKIKDIFRSLGSLPRRTLAVTDGERGAYLSHEGKILFAEPLPIKRVNTTGAGDAFGSGLVAGLMKKDDLDYAFRVAMANSQSVIQKLGAKKGLLTRLPHPYMRKTIIRPF